MTDKIGVAIVEDEELLSSLLADWISMRPNFEVIGKFSDVASVSAAKQRLVKDCGLMIVDVNLPDGDGLEVIHEVASSAGRKIPVVVISGRPTRDLFERLYRELDGAWAMLLKGSNGLTNLEHAIQAVQQGLVMVDPQLRQSASPLGGSLLTIQERDVMKHVAMGSSNATVATHVFMSEKSVERVLHSIYKKYGLEGTSKRDNPRVRATLMYLGLVPTPED
jgi:two-component system, NarL family, response regulator DevR